MKTIALIAVALATAIGVSFAARPSAAAACCAPGAACCVPGAPCCE